MNVLQRLSPALPILGAVAGYRRADFAADAVAGAIVGIVTIPQAIAYAVLAGLPAQAGLYACLVPMVAYALLGSSRELVVGPVAIAAIMVAVTVQRHLDAFGGDYAALTSTLCIEVGVLLFVLRAAGLAGFVNLISQPVLGGFINAAVILIVVSQIDEALGIGAGAGDSVVARIAHALASLGSTNAYALALAGGGFVLLAATRVLAPRLLRLFGVDAGSEHPIGRIGPLLAAFAGGAAIVLFDLDVRHGVEVVGSVPQGLPILAPPATDPALWARLVPSAAMIGLVAAIESYSLGARLAMRNDRTLDADQELVALGAANVAAGLTGAYPVAGSLSRSGVNVAAGARTPVASLVCAAVIVVTLLWLTPLMAHLPHAVLAAIIIASVLPMANLREIAELWKLYRGDAATHVATLAGALLFDVETGIGIGVVLSIAVFLRRSALPEVTEVGRIGDTTQFRSVDRFDVTTHRDVLLLRVDESLSFANADHVERRVLEHHRERPEARHIVLLCTPVNYIDIDGLDMLLRLNAFFRGRGLLLHLTDVKTELRRRLDRTDLPQRLHGRMFDSADDAVSRLGGEALPAVDDANALAATAPPVG